MHSTPQAREIQLIGVDRFELLSSTQLEEDDAITAVVPLGEEPYLVLGCRSGAIRTVALLGDTGLPAEPNCPVASVSLRRYTGTARDECVSATLAVKLWIEGRRG